MSKNLPFTVTDSALHRFEYMVAKESKKKALHGIRIRIVHGKGCGGHKYSIEYAYELFDFDEKIIFETHGTSVPIILDPKTLFKISGSKIDYQDSDISSEFSFFNPNEKKRCGCGESFYM